MARLFIDSDLRVLSPCSGRSEEAAEVIFERRDDALAAQKRYNNLALDNKPMKIELIEDVDAPGAGRTLASGIRQAFTLSNASSCEQMSHRTKSIYITNFLLMVI